MSVIRVFVVDDVAVIRRIIVHIPEEEQAISVAVTTQARVGCHWFQGKRPWSC